MTIDKFSRRNGSTCFNSPSVPASMVNVYEHFSKSLIVQLCFGCFNVFPDHSLGRKTRLKHCARPESFSLCEKTIVGEVRS